MDSSKQLRHAPVMVKEVLKLLDPIAGGFYCDATAGGGGHSAALLEATKPDGKLLAVDQDPEAVDRVRDQLARFGDRVSVVHGSFSSLPDILEQQAVGPLDGLVVDLGVSSFQLGTAERGFSFQKEGPLDMRMDTTRGQSVKELIASLDEKELARIIKDYGEERHCRAVARSVLQALSNGELETTTDLAKAVRRAVKGDSGSIDAATRSFQALRIAVNDELGQLRALLAKLPEVLGEGGRAAFIAFHSLEDRIVKQGIRHWARCRCRPRDPVCICGGPLVKDLSSKPQSPSDEEVAQNPRARSARLRGCELLPSAEAA